VITRGKMLSQHKSKPKKEMFSENMEAIALLA